MIRIDTKESYSPALKKQLANMTDDEYEEFQEAVLASIKEEKGSEISENRTGYFTPGQAKNRLKKNEKKK